MNPNILETWMPSNPKILYLLLQIAYHVLQIYDFFGAYSLWIYILYPVQIYI